jgi:tetratricopeptide (TPR) repeat protein
MMRNAVQAAFKQRWFLYDDHRWRGVIALAFTNCSMLCSGLLPWLRDPLGAVYSAWNLPIDVGWQLRTGWLNYGLLCTACALYAALCAFAHGRSLNSRGLFVWRPRLMAALCIAPVALFLLQYLCVDMAANTLLARHEIQLLLIQQHFGYDAAPQLIPLSSFALDSSTLWGRLQLLLDLLSFGPLLPCLSTWIIIDYSQPYEAVSVAVTRKARGKRSGGAWLVAGIILFILLGRAPVAMACDDEAKALLSSGAYATALAWLDAARLFNPSFEQTAFYHIERGQALYFLSPEQQSDDSRAYLAFTYHQMGDDLDAYQELLPIWQAGSADSWKVDELSLIVEKLAESPRPLRNFSIADPRGDSAALSWLPLLARIDSTNVYSAYMLGRIQYDLRNYPACIRQLSRVISLSANIDIRSSAYTYIALSDNGLGEYAKARDLLFKAVALDPSYRNNTAREALSGLQ